MWAFDTLSYATSSTFPSGGPAAAETEGQGFGAGGGGRFLRGFGAGGPAGPALFGSSGSGASPGWPRRGGPPARRRRRRCGRPRCRRAASAARPPGGAGAGFGGSPFGGNAASLNTALSYIDTHGGGTLAVSSQSGAASAIIARGANVVGIGGFSGRESEVSRSWLAERGPLRARSAGCSSKKAAPVRARPGPASSGGLGALAARGRLLRRLLLRRCSAPAAPAGRPAKPVWAPKR